VSEDRIRQLLSELIEEIDKAESIDSETVTLAKQLESDIHDFVNPDVDTEENTILDDAIALEALFAASHPVAEKTIRELVNSLSRIGI
jgi:hypothetical protein